MTGNGGLSRPIPSEAFQKQTVEKIKMSDFDPEEEKAEVLAHVQSISENIRELSKQQLEAVQAQQDGIEDVYNT